MKACDYGHDATKVRRLRLTGGAGVFVCRAHWQKEMRWRKARNKHLTGAARFSIRKWPG